MEEIQVKQVVLNGEKTHYFIFSNGDLYNAKTHRISTGAKNHGYIRYTLTINDKDISIFKHQLLAQNFIFNDDPEHKTVVHHKDGCPQNNSLDNLEWTTQKVNCEKRVNINEHKIVEQLTEEELRQEEWRPFRDTFYEVSSMGRIKNLKTGKITFGSRNKNSGYIRWTFTDSNGNRKEIQAHRAVYETFNPNEEVLIINHIDSNRGNNRLTNLENISQSENVIKSYYLTKTKRVVITGQYDLETKQLINVYESTTAAAKALGLNNASNLSRAIKTGQQSHGYYWKEITKEEFDDFKNKKNEVSL